MKPVAQNMKTLYEWQKRFLSLSPYAPQDIWQRLDMMAQHNHYKVMSFKVEVVGSTAPCAAVDLWIQDGDVSCILMLLLVTHGRVKFPELLTLSDGGRKVVADSVDFAVKVMIAQDSAASNVVGMIFDQELHTHISENFQMYNWERVCPSTVFCPAVRYRRHMERYKFARDFITEDMVVLDAGCGFGYGTKYLAQSGAKIVAVDIAPDVLRRAAQWFYDDNIKWLLGDVHTFPVPDNSVDCLVLLETIEHILDPYVLMREIHRVVKPGGRCIISTPNAEAPSRMGVTNPYHWKEYGAVEFHSIVSRDFHTTMYGYADRHAFLDDHFYQFDFSEHKTDESCVVAQPISIIAVGEK